MSQVVAIHDTEGVLATGMLSGSRQAYDKLYRKYAPALYSIILQATGNEKAAEDLLLEAFIEIWSSRYAYEPGRERLFIWMYRIASRHIAGYVKKDENNIMSKNRDASYFVNSISTGTIDDEVLKLMYIDRLSIADVCGILNTSEDKLKLMLRSAVNKLKNLAR